MPIHGADGAGDILAQISNAFQIGCDAQCGDDLTQILCHRLATGNDQNSGLFNFLLHLVDGAVSGGCRLRCFYILTHQRVDGFFNHAFCLAAHFCNATGQVAQVVII